jgi:hypothetical protein
MQASQAAASASDNGDTVFEINSHTYPRNNELKILYCICFSL